MRFSPRFLVGVAIAILGLTAGALFWNRAFPTAALQFTITESAAETKARAFLKETGFDTKGYLTATQFGEDTKEKNYIEKEYGLKVLEEKVRQGVNIWYWTVRLFKPEQEEEISVAYDPQGRFVGVFHHIPEKAARPFLTREQARVVAEDFLKKYVTHHPFDQLRLIEDSSSKKPKRTDYFFTWEQDNLKLGDAPYQIHVTVKGDQVGSFNENVKVPEAWQRTFATQRSTNALFQQFASFASIPIMVGALVLFILYTMHHRLRWRGAIPFRWLLLIGVVEALEAWNNLPDLLSGYSTTEKWGSFLFGLASSSLLSVAMTVASMYLISLVADAIYREQLPDKLPFSKALGRNSLYQPEVVRGLGVGIVLACFGIGYVCTFYVIASHFGAWSPVDVDYSKIIGGPIPWISGIQVGMSAAWTEEFLFRVIGILLYWKVLRLRASWKWIGIVLACMTWAFLHSNYPQMPGYLRGCELTVEGILWGAILVRFGIVATLTGHYLYDCWLSSIIVFQSADPLHQLGAILVSIWPVLLWMIGVHYLRTGQKPPELPEEPDETLPPPVVEDVAAKSWDFRTHVFTGGQRLLFTITAVLCLTVLECSEAPYDAMGDFGEIALSRTQITTQADKILRKRGFNPATYRHVTTLFSSSTESDYLLDYGTPDEIAYLFDTEWPDLLWSVRYFRIGQKEEFTITLDKDGNLVRWRHAVPRESNGASLDKAAALELAKKYLTEEQGIDFANEKLIEDDLTQQAHRRDYLFTWERKDWDWGDSQLRTQITIQGDEPVNFNRFVKVPDEWYREEEKKYGGWKDAILSQISSWSSAAISGVMLIAFIILLRRGHIPWKPGFLLALIPTALQLIEKLNALPWFFSGYSTTKPLTHFLLGKIGGDLAGLFYAWLSTGLRLSVVLGLLAWAFGWTLRHWQWPEFSWRALSRTVLDYIPLLLVSLALLWITDYFQSWLNFVTTDKPGMSIDYPSVNVAVPWLATLIDSMQGAFNKMLQYGFIASVAVLIHRRVPWLVWTLLLVYPLYSALHADTVRDFIRDASTSEFEWLLAIFLVWKLWRFDASLMFVVLTLRSLIPDLELLYDKGGPVYKVESIPLMIAAAVLIILGWWLRPGKAKPPIMTAAAAPLSPPPINPDPHHA